NRPVHRSPAPPDPPPSPAHAPPADPARPPGPARASSPSLIQQDQRYRRYSLKNTGKPSDHITIMDHGRTPQVLGLQRHGRAQGTLGLFLKQATRFWK